MCVVGTAAGIGGAALARGSFAIVDIANGNTRRKRLFRTVSTSLEEASRVKPLQGRKAGAQRVNVVRFKRAHHSNAVDTTICHDSRVRAKPLLQALQPAGHPRSESRL